jgi:glucose-1-phosphatase
MTPPSLPAQSAPAPPKGGIRAVLFDLGGLFVDVDVGRGFRALHRAFPALSETAIREACLAPDLLGAYEKGRITTAGFHDGINRLLGLNIPFERFRTGWQDVFTPNPPLIRFLHGLPPQIRKIVLSNTNELHVQFISAHFDILGHFDGHVYSHESGSAKPEKEIYLKALSVAGAGPGECLFVDDNEANVAAAEALGIPSYRFTGNEAFFRFWEDRNE